ncbi:hypothetical protein ACO1O0_003343 [Amphichorda felina]
MASATWPRIVHILLAMQLLPLTALLLSQGHMLGLGFVPGGFSLAVAGAILRLRSRGDRHTEQVFFAASVLRVLDAIVAGGLLLVLAVSAVLSPWEEDVGLMGVYSGVVMGLLLALHTFLAVRGYWVGSGDEPGYVPLPKADKPDKTDEVDGTSKV